MVNVEMSVIVLVEITVDVTELNLSASSFKSSYSRKYLVGVGVTVPVTVPVMVPVARIVVEVSVVDGVGMLKQEQALEIAIATQLVGKALGLGIALEDVVILLERALRSLFAAAVGFAVNAESRQVSVDVDVKRVVVAVSVYELRELIVFGEGVGILTTVVVDGT